VGSSAESLALPHPAGGILAQARHDQLTTGTESGFGTLIAKARGWRDSVEWLRAQGSGESAARGDKQLIDGTSA